MNYEDGKMTSIKLKGDQLKLALLMGRGNMSAGLKVCLYVVEQLLHQDADLERLHTIVRNRIGVSPQELADQLKHTSAAAFTVIFSPAKGIPLLRCQRRRSACTSP